MAAAALAVITLSVFYVLQDYGPESAIRRFHHAVQVGDANELARVTEQSLQDPSTSELARWVNQMSRLGAHYRLLRVDREPSKVYAALEYVLPNGETYPTVWIVDRTERGGTWRVDAQSTVMVLDDNPVGSIR